MAAGPRAAARLAVDRAHGREDGGKRLTGRDLTQSSGPGAEVAATWSTTRAGAKGEEEEEEAPGIGRPTTREAFRRAAANRSERPPPAARGGQGESAAAEAATRRGDKGEGRRPWGSQGEVMGIPGSVAARGIDARGADDGGLRRRQSPEIKRGKHDETTRVRFKGVGASPGFKESVSGVGLDGAAPRLAGDERRPPGQSKSAWRAMASGGGRDASRGRRRIMVGSSPIEEEAALAARSVSRRGVRDAKAARHREGAAGEEGRERWCPELLVTRLRTHRLLRCFGNGRQRRERDEQQQGGDGGSAAMARWV
uniref:Kinase substrate protein n=2 Tax=Oryza sativa subsp. japonica TaxID=39947 RepID=Q8S707_ORYSJ|nr:hypothetical protein [Oryza sativa Japonica Group]AAM94528.1 putative kinase substrate protein [Oryza sativa Japonica Group]